MSTLALVVALASGHPLHVSTATVNIGSTGAGSVTIRAFADDLPWAGDSLRAADYLATRFLVTDARGRRLPLVLVSVRFERDALIFDLKLGARASCEGLRIWHGLLAERYSDQVNLVQARCGGLRRQLIFSAGEGSKTL